ncbi:MAG TPA: GspH/FimT family pseudopilin [Thermoanaerobaculia bacterium]|nr:GspH/FimT family pseudopilin [Thermoanaerobaculia bacterium]
MRGNRGFSLVELLVVMVIMALVSVIAIPWFVKIGQRNQLKSAAFEVQTTLLAARMKAVKRNQPVTIVINNVAPVELLTVEPPPPAPTPTLVPGRLALPSTAAVLYATPAIAGGAVTFGGDGRLAMPAPTPTPGAYEYVLRGPVGARTPNQITIQAWPNGRIAVITPTHWY